MRQGSTLNQTQAKNRSQIDSKVPFGPTLARMEKWGPRGKPGYPGHQNRPVRQVSGPRMTAKHYRVSLGPLETQVVVQQ